MIGHFRRHKSLGAVAGVLALLLSAGPALAQTYFWWQVRDEMGQEYTGENVQCSVFRPQVHAAILLHAGAAGPALSGGATTGPLWSDVNGKFHFYSTSSDPVDITCWYNFGGGGFSGRMDRFSHNIVLPRTGMQISRFAVVRNAATYQTNSGITLPPGALVRDVIIQNLAPGGIATTLHISVGFLGDHAVGTANALVSHLALTGPDEWLRPHAAVLAAGAQRFFYTENHRGGALSRFIAGHVVGTIGAGSPGTTGTLFPGVYQEIAYLVHVASGLQVSYSAGTNGGVNAGIRIHVYVVWQKFHTAANALGFGLGR